MAQKRKYTKKKIKLSLISIKKIAILILSAFLIHFMYVNVSILLKSTPNTQVLIVHPTDKINSTRLSSENKDYLLKNISYFWEKKMRKILILTQENIFDISSNEIIQLFLIENTIWWGSIANQQNIEDNFNKTIQSFLIQQDFKTATLLSPYWEYYKNVNIFQADNNNIYLEPYYKNISDIIIGNFKNYYYFWKNKL